MFELKVLLKPKGQIYLPFHMRELEKFLPFHTPEA